MSIKTILIDDEQHNLANLQALLQQYCPQVVICGIEFTDEFCFQLRTEVKKHSSDLSGILELILA